MFRCNCFTGTVAIYWFLVPVSQGGAVLFAPPRKALAFLTTPLRVPKAWHRDFAACGQRSGLLALNLASIFEKLLDQKTFVCLRLVLGTPLESDLARLGHILSLPWELQFSLRFLLHFIVQSCYLLRKCGLLAHTSPTFLKNCWIKKLFNCLRLVVYSQSFQKAAASSQEVAAFLQNILKIK